MYDGEFGKNHQLILTCNFDVTPWRYDCSPVPEDKHAPNDSLLGFGNSGDSRVGLFAEAQSADRGDRRTTAASCSTPVGALSQQGKKFPFLHCLCLKRSLRMAARWPFSMPATRPHQ
jgi:hypothetical protein